MSRWTDRADARVLSSPSPSSSSALASRQRARSTTTAATTTRRVIAEALESRRLLTAAAVSHIYELNGNFSDTLNGPSLVAPASGGTFKNNGYAFKSGTGLTLTTGVDPEEYSIELRYNFDASAPSNGYKRVLAFTATLGEYGPYDLNNLVTFYPYATGPTAVPQGTTMKDVVFTREKSSKKVSAYVNGTKQFEFVDGGATAVFSSPDRLATFFKDNASENGSGFIDRLRIYKGVLTGTQVTSLHNGGTPPGLATGVTAAVASNQLTINGTVNADAIGITVSGTNAVVKAGALNKSFALSSFSSIVVNADKGNDTISLAAGITKPSKLNGNDGNDTITGGGGADVIDGGAGADVIKGGGGNDTADYSARTTSVNLFKDGRANDGAVGERDNIGSDIETLVGGSKDDVIVGSTGNELLKGNAGNDYLFGGLGNDTLDGGTGDDELAGDEGNDSLIGGAGKDQLYGDAGSDTLIGKDGEADLLDGGADSDKASRDTGSVSDSVFSIESFIA